jgi:hypothetical protein
MLQLVLLLLVPELPVLPLLVPLLLLLPIRASTHYL